MITPNTHPTMPTKPDATKKVSKTAGENPAKPETSLARAHKTELEQIRSELSARRFDGEIMDELARRFHASELADKLEAIMSATTPPIVTRDGDVVTRPDYPTRLRAIDLTLAYLVGRPIERTLAIRAGKPQTPESLLDDAAKSPAMCDALIDALVAIRGKQKAS